MERHTSWSKPDTGPHFYARMIPSYGPDGRSIEPEDENRRALLVMLLASFDDWRAIAFEGTRGTWLAIGEGKRRWVIGTPRKVEEPGYPAGSLTKGVRLPIAIARVERFAGLWFEAGCSLDAIDADRIAALERFVIVQRGHAGRYYRGGDENHGECRGTYDEAFHFDTRDEAEPYARQVHGYVIPE